MSGVYKNVFQTPEITVLLSLRAKLLITICIRTPSIIVLIYNSKNRVRIARRVNIACKTMPLLINCAKKM